MSFLTLYSLASLYPGPSPRLFSLSLPDTIGSIVGNLTTSGLKLFTKPEALSYETIKCAEKTVRYIKRCCNDLQLMKMGRHDWTKEQAGNRGIIIKYAFSTTPIVALERAARLAALKVQFFVKSIGIKENEGFNAIKSELETGTVFTEAQKWPKKIVRPHVNAFFDEVEQILIRQIRASDPGPTWIDCVGFGIQWGTQIGLTWLGRYVAWQYYAEFFPDSFLGNSLYYTGLAGAAYMYFGGLNYHSRNQLNVLSSEPKKLDCREYLSRTTIEEILEAAKTHLLFNDELRAAYEADLFELEEKLLVLAGLKLGCPR